MVSSPAGAGVRRSFTTPVPGGRLLQKCGSAGSAARRASHRLSRCRWPRPSPAPPAGQRKSRRRRGGFSGRRRVRTCRGCSRPALSTHLPGWPSPRSRPARPRSWTPSATLSPAGAAGMPNCRRGDETAGGAAAPIGPSGDVGAQHRPQHLSNDHGEPVHDQGWRGKVPGTGCPAAGRLRNEPRAEQSGRSVFGMAPHVLHAPQSPTDLRKCPVRTSQRRACPIR